MQKIRYYLAAIVLVVTLSGPALLATGAGSLAKAASSQHTTVSSVAIKPYWPCPTVGNDC